MDSARTSPTLLGRLRQMPADQAAWGEFVERYGPKIYEWCRHWRLQEADGRDVTQTVLLKLAEKMRTFAYDPSRRFRGWLKTITRHALHDFVESRNQAGARAGSGGTQVLEALHSLEAREDLVKRLDEEFDRELLDEAMSRVRLRVEPRTWDAFQLLSLEGWSGAQAAEKLQMKVATVFVAKSKVLRMLQAEMQTLDKPQPR
jgi:RNA polymerase sigma factor (sigma-70 family)